MKRSGRITLTIVGALSLTACDEGPDTRNVYRTREDCIADYSEAECKEESGSGGHAGGTSGGRWFGPGYQRNSSVIGADNPGPGRASRAMMSEPIIHRGGFGGFGHSFSSGG